jgi:hypothetical protein
MRALLRRELEGLLRGCLWAGVLGGLGLASSRELILPYGPSVKSELGGGSLFALACLATGAALGLGQWATERSQGTERYLNHRASGPRRAYDAKALAGMLGLSLTLLVALSIHLVSIELFGPYSAGARYELALQYLAIGTLLLSAHAVALWASSWARNTGWRALVALLGVLSLRAWSDALIRADRDLDPPTMLFVGLQLAVVIAFHGHGRWLYGSLTEVDRPLPAKLAWSTAALSLLLVGNYTYHVLGLSSQRLRSVVVDSSDELAVGADGEVFPVRQSEGQTYRVVADGLASLPSAAEDGREEEERPATILRGSWPPLSWIQTQGRALRRPVYREPFRIDARWPHVESPHRGRSRAWLDLRNGSVWAEVEPHEDRLELRSLGRGTERLSRHTLIVFPVSGGSVEPAPALLYDPADRTAWTLVRTATSAHLEQRSLPDGSPFEGVERVHGESRARFGFYEPYGYSDVLVVRGGGRHWEWDGDRFLPFEPDATEVLESDFAAAQEYTVTVLTPDELAPEIEVRRTADGESLLRAVLEPVGVRGRAALAAVLALTTLRGPLTGAVAYSQDVRDVRTPGPFGPWFYDPALAGGRRPWLLLVGAVVSLALAFGVRRRCAQRRYWLPIVALGGLPAWIVCLAVEPPRPRAES